MKLFPEVQWTGTLSPASREEYDAATRTFLSHLEKKPELVAIYQQGEPAILGLSDIDWICVLEDQLTQSHPEDFSAKRLFGSDSLAFPGEPVVAPRRVFRHLKEAFPFMEGHLLYGEAIVQEEYTSQDKFFLDAIQTADSLGFYWLEYARRLGVASLPIRPTLTFLNGIVHTLELLSHLFGENRWEEFVEEVKALRKGWFHLNHDRLERLDTLWKEAAEVLAEAILAVDRHLTEKRWLLPKGERAAQLTTDDGGVVLFAPLTEISPHALALKLFEWNAPEGWRSERMWRSPVVILPMSLGAQLGIYAKEGRGKMARAIRRAFRDHLPETTSLDPLYEKWLIRRIKVMDEQAEFLWRNGFQFGGLFSTVANPPHCRRPHQDLIRRTKWTAARIVLEFVRPFRIAGTVQRWKEFKQQCRQSVS